MRPIILAVVLTCAVAMNAVPAHADDIDFHMGPYAGIGLGGSNLNVASRPSRSSKEVDTGVLKLYGGYQFTEKLGVEGGYIRTGHIEVTDSIDGIDVTRTARTRAVYVAATGRLPVTSAFSVTGKLGMSYGDVNDGDVAPIPETIYGSKISAMVGVGARYQVSDRMSLSLDYDHVGKESRQLSVDIVTLTLSRSF
jgi:OmpA-OmpF porin, OOP family